MKMSIGEKKILFVFGCPNREATVDRLYQVADLIPDPAGRKKPWKFWLRSWTAKV